MIDDQTETQKFPLPHPSNLLADDVLRLRAALQQADAELGALQEAVAGKAAQPALDLAFAALDAVYASLLELQSGKVASVNGVAGQEITLLPQDLRLGPANGASEGSITYDPDSGRVSKIVQTVLGYPATSTIAYDAAGAVTQVQTVYRGLLRTETYRTDGAGRIAGFSATEVAA